MKRRFLFVFSIAAILVAGSVAFSNYTKGKAQTQPQNPKVTAPEHSPLSDTVCYIAVCRWMRPARAVFTAEAQRSRRDDAEQKREKKRERMLSSELLCGSSARSLRLCGVRAVALICKPYKHLFLHQLLLDKKATDEEKLGKDGKVYRDFYKRQAKLTEAQAKDFDQIAKETEKEFSRITSQAQEII